MITLRNLIRANKAATAIEYALLATFIALAMIASLVALAPKLANVFTQVATKLP